MNDRPDPTNPDASADDRLHTLLVEHFADELQPYVGSAGRRFLADAPERAPAVSLRLADDAPATASPRGDVIGRIKWALPLLAAAAAVAMVAIPTVRVWLRPSGAELTRVDPGTRSPGVNQTPPVAGGGDAVAVSFDPQVEGSVFWQYRDAGQVFLDSETVARRLIRTEYQTLEWVDPEDRSLVQVTVPRQQVVLLGAPRH